MPTSPAASALRKPAGSTRIPAGALAYLRAQNQATVYDLVLGELKRSGISKATLARRLGIGADSASKLLRAPRNWTLDTVSDLLFAITGSTLAYALSNPVAAGDASPLPPAWLAGAMRTPGVAPHRAAPPARSPRRGSPSTAPGKLKPVRRTRRAA